MSIFQTKELREHRGFDSWPRYMCTQQARLSWQRLNRHSLSFLSPFPQTFTSFLLSHFPSFFKISLIYHKYHSDLFVCLEEEEELIQEELCRKAVQDVMPRSKAARSLPPRHHPLLFLSLPYPDKIRVR